MSSLCQTSYKQLQKQFDRQKLLSTILSFTSVEYAVYVIDATAKTIRRTVDNDVSPLPMFSMINVGRLRVPNRCFTDASTRSDSTITESIVH